MGPAYDSVGICTVSFAEHGAEALHVKAVLASNILLDLPQSGYDFILHQGKSPIISCGVQISALLRPPIAGGWLPTSTKAEVQSSKSRRS